MHKSNSDDVKKKIIKILTETEECTIGYIKNKLNTGHKTILNNCKLWNEIGVITMDKKITGSQEMTFIKLTERGEEVAITLGFKIKYKD